MARRLAAAITGLALGISVLPLAAAPASAALQSGVAFTGAGLSTWQTDGIVWAAAAAGGKVFVGGDFSAVRAPGTAAGDASSLTRTNLAVLDGATGKPLDCAPAVTGSTNASVRALEVSPDGETLYIGGSFTALGSATGRKHLAALDISSCTPVADFAPQPSAPVRAVEATGSAVYFGGLMSYVGSTARARAAAVAAVGAPEAGSLLLWDPQFDNEVLAIAVRPGGSEVVVGGRFDLVNGASSHALAVVDPVDGDNRFVYGGLVPAKSVVKDIAVDSTGFYTANEGTGFQEFDGRIAFDWSSHGQRWRDTCLGATQAVVVYAGVLYSGSHVHDCTTMNSFPDGLRYHLLAQSVTDPTLLPWFPQTNDGIGEALGPRDVVVSDGDSDFLWVVGEFTTVNGVRQQGLTRFGQSAAAQAAPTVPTASVSSVRAGEVRVAWRQSFDADDATLTYSVFRDGVLVHTVSGTSWFWERKQMTFVDTAPAPGSSVSYKVSVTDGNKTATTVSHSVTVASQDSAYASRVVADGASGLWRYDEPSSVLFADTSAAGYNLTLTGGTAGYRVTPGAVVGDASAAMSVPGTKATLYGEQRLPAPGAFSVETWFKTTTTAGGKLIGFGDKQVLPSRNFDRHVYMTDDGRLVFGVDNGSRVALTTAKSYNDGVWHHVVGTQGSAGMTLYVDGAKVAGNGTTTAMKVAGYWRVAGDNISCRVTTCAGRVWPNAPTSDHFGGQLDETAVYAKALPAETVAAHYALATGTVPPPPPAETTRTVLVPAQADTMVKQASSSSSFGAANPLLSDGQDLSTTGSAVHSYLRFDVPALAEGERITAASLRLRTVPSYGGTSNGPVVWRTADTSSVTSLESMTWNSGRPQRSSAVGNFGSLPSDAHVSTPVSGVGVGLVSFELAPESNDAIVFRSEEDATAGNRPQLVLTVSSEPPPPAETTRTVLVPAQADTMVKQASSSSSFGAANPLLSDGQDLSTTGSAVHSYLRFDVPALAEGERITAASLRLRTVPSYGGTSNGPVVWRTADTSSVTSLESMTWNSGRPQRSSAVGNFGSLPSDAHVSTPVSGVGVGLVSFELAPESNDAIVFRSEEDGTSASRPVLSLTVSSG